MAKSVFYSFHYDRDAWRVQQIIQMGALEGQPILNAQQWEEVKRKGDAAIKPEQGAGIHEGHPSTRMAPVSRQSPPL